MISMVHGEKNLGETWKKLLGVFCSDKKMINFSSDDVNCCQDVTSVAN